MPPARDTTFVGFLIALIALASITASPSVLRGQVSAAADSAAGPRDAIAALQAGQRLKVRLQEGWIHEGRFVGFDGDRVTLRGDDVRYLPLGELSVVWTRGHSAGTGALIGAGSGLVLGGLAGAVLGSLGCSTAGGDDCALEGALAVGGLGAAGGAGLGALIGVLIPRWVQRWP